MTTSVILWQLVGIVILAIVWLALVTTHVVTGRRLGCYLGEASRNISAYGDVCRFLQWPAEKLDELFMRQNRFESRLRMKMGNGGQMTKRENRQQASLRRQVRIAKFVFWTLWSISKSYGIHVPGSYQNFLRMSNPNFKLDSRWIPTSGF